MAKKKSMMILVAVLLVLVIATILVMCINQKNENISTYGESILDFDESDVTAFSIDYDNQYSFVKETVDDESTEEGESSYKWVLEGNESFPVSTEIIDTLISYLNGLSATFKIEGTDQFSDYGLLMPECSLELTVSGETYTIDFGSYSSMDSKRYVSIGDGNAYMIAEDITDYYYLSEDDFIELDDSHSGTTAESFTISGDNTLSIVYKEDAGYCYSDEYVYYMKSGASYLPLGEDEAESLITEIMGRNFYNYVSYSASTEKLSKYGLDSPNLTVKLTYLDYDDEEQEVTAYLGKTKKNYYLMFDGSEIIYDIGESIYEVFEDACYDTLKPTEVVNADWENVDSVDIELDDNTYHIDFDVYSDGTFEYTMEDEDVDFEEVVSAIDLLEIDEFMTETPGKEELKLTLNLDNETYESAELIFSKYNGSYCLVSFNGEVLGTVLRSDVVDLIESINTIVLD